MKTLRGPDHHGALELVLAVFLFASPAQANEDSNELELHEQREILDPPVVDLDDIAEPRRRRGWHLGIEAVTDIPINVGGQITLVMPGGFRLSTSFGVLPRRYLETVNGVIVAAGGYDEATATLVLDLLDNPFVFRAHAGWRPSRAHGFYMEVGYGMATIDGGLASSALLASAMGQSLPPRVPGDLEFVVDSTIHMVDVEVGWELVFADHVVLRFAVGAALTVGAHTQITPDEAVRNLPSIDEYTQQASEVISDIYREYVFTPTVSVDLGYRFF